MKRTSLNVLCDKDVIITKKLQNYIYDIIECFERKITFDKEVYPLPIKLIISSKTNDIHYINWMEKSQGIIEIDKDIIKPNEMPFRVRIDVFMRYNKVIQVDNVMLIV